MLWYGWGEITDSNKKAKTMNSIGAAISTIGILIFMTFVTNAHPENINLNFVYFGGAVTSVLIWLLMGE